MKINLICVQVGIVPSFEKRLVRTYESFLLIPKRRKGRRKEGREEGREGERGEGRL